jgi:GNAT superfamily N-acetyltransferase
MFMCGNLELRVAGDRHRVAIRSFLERLSQSTAYARYLGPVSTTDTFWSERELNRLLDGNDSGHVVVLAVDATDAIRAVGEFVQERNDAAEVAMVVEDGFQGRGVGKCLFQNLQRLAWERGIRTFTGDMAHDNSRMRGLLRQVGRELRLEYGRDAYQFRLVLDG